MKRTSSRILSLFLALVLLCGALALPASAATAEAQQAANTLYELGLFYGVGTLPDGSPNFDLDSSATRAQAVVMLVRLLGAEQEAQTTHYTHPFNDVPSWASDYVGYATTKKITNGISTTQFGSNNKITANQFVTMVLRALGYSNVDYRDPSPVAKSVGLTCPTTSNFLRGDMAVVCLSALSCRVYGSSLTLRQQLQAKGAISNPSTGSKVNLQTFYQSVCSKYEGFNANMAVEGDALDNWYAGLKALSPKQTVIYTPMISAVACEIALVEVGSAADVQKVKNIFQARINYQTVDNGSGNPGAWYPATVEEWETNSRIVSNGNYVMLIVWKDCDKIVADFNALF